MKKKVRLLILFGLLLSQGFKYGSGGENKTTLEHYRLLSVCVCVCVSRYVVSWCVQYTVYVVSRCGWLGGCHGVCVCVCGVTVCLTVCVWVWCHSVVNGVCVCMLQKHVCNVFISVLWTAVILYHYRRQIFCKKIKKKTF